MVAKLYGGQVLKEDNRTDSSLWYSRKLHFNYLTWYPLNKWGYQNLHKRLDPDNIHDTEINLLDDAIKDQHQSDIILLFDTLSFLRALDFETKTSIFFLKFVHRAQFNLWTMKTRTILTLVLAYVSMLNWLWPSCIS